MNDHRRVATWGGAILGALLALGASAYAQVTQPFQRTVSLTANGRVSLDNINGNVEITGWDRNEVAISAVKTANTQQKLDEARIDVESGADYVNIATKYPEGRTNNNPANVNYTLSVPRGARLEHISLVNGSLTVQHLGGRVEAKLVNGKAHVSDLAGETDISGVNGSIEAEYASLSNVQEIKLHSVNGSIELGLPESPNAEVTASTMNGGIHTDFPLQVKGEWVGKHLSGTLGSGGTRIELNNVNGSIHIGSAHGSL